MGPNRRVGLLLLDLIKQMCEEKNTQKLIMGPWMSNIVTFVTELQILRYSISGTFYWLQHSVLDYNMLNVPYKYNLVIS